MALLVKPALPHYTLQSLWYVRLLAPEDRRTAYLAHNNCLITTIYSSLTFGGFLYLLHLGQLSPCVLIIPQVLLVSHQDDGDIGTEVLHLRRPLLRNIFCPGRDMLVSRDTQESDYKKGQPVQSHGTEHFSWWIALQTAWGKDVFSCTNPTSHEVH